MLHERMTRRHLNSVNDETTSESQAAGLDFGECYAACSQMVRKTIGKRRIQDFDKDDCEQEVWLAVLTSGSNLPDRRRLNAWICMIARNKAVDLLRKQYRIKNISNDHMENLPEPNGVESGDVDAPSIWKAMAKLDLLADPRSCLVFALRCVENWSYDEIAAMLDMTPAQARLRNHRVKVLARRVMSVSIDV